MNFKTRLRQKENYIWALGMSVVLCAVVGVFFDYYYDLNDDVLIKDILAGVYTGTPEGRNIQMLFPLSFFISLFYRVAGGLPWYGIFLCLCHFGSICLITARMLDFIKKRAVKVAALLLEAAVIVSLFLRELVFTQYTVTCTLLAAAAAFLFYTSREEKTVKGFFLRNLPCILLVTVAFQLRSEMLLLVLPLICVTGLCRWCCEKPFFTKENAAKYFSVLGGILAGIALSQGIHMAAHGGADWQEFNRYFDNRTELYDFYWQWRPSYENNEAFYESIGMTKYSRMLIENYNFGLDEKIDADILKKISDYAAETRKQQASFAATLKQAVVDYKYRTLHDTDYPWNLFVIAMYFMILAAALRNRHFRFLWELPCMFFVRSGLWLFILYRGRAPERITHSLYLMEFVILLAMLLWECKEEREGKTGKAGKAGKAGGLQAVMKPCFGVILAGLCVISLGGSVKAVRAEYTAREATNRDWAALQEYVGAREENFYFVDVYSTVRYSEKLFCSVDNTISNYDIMGGWASKSPLNKKKLQYFGIASMEQSLLEQDNVFVIVQAEEPQSLPSFEESISGYYAERGEMTELYRVDGIFLDGEEIFSIYKPMRTALP